MKSGRIRSEGDLAGVTLGWQCAGLWRVGVRLEAARLKLGGGSDKGRNIY